MNNNEDLQLLAAALEDECHAGKWRYIEMRPLEPLDIVTPLSHCVWSYSFHQLDLQPDLDTLLHSFHKSSTQRKIRRAEREGLTYREGSTDLLDSFYRLLTLTRRRHKIPPQPKKWFQNLIECFGEALRIRLACKNGRAIAGMLTIRYKDTLVYKYGCSDTRFKSLGGTHLLFWKAIQEAKNAGLRTFDRPHRCRPNRPGDVQESVGHYPERLDVFKVHGRNRFSPVFRTLPGTLEGTNRKGDIRTLASCPALDDWPCSLPPRRMTGSIAFSISLFTTHADKPQEPVG